MTSCAVFSVGDQSAFCVRPWAPQLLCQGVRAWGPSTVPLACMPCGGLRAAGLVGGLPLGAGLPPFRGASGVSRCLSPCCPSLGAGSKDPLPVCPGHGWCGYGRPSISVTARALASRRFALPGWREGVPGGGAMRRSDGCLRSATHVLWARACGRGGPVPLAGMPCGELRVARVVGLCSGGDGLPPL